MSQVRALSGPFAFAHESIKFLGSSWHVEDTWMNATASVPLYNFELLQDMWAFGQMED